ncbi:MAG: Fic family protein [Verrucomicrobiota bacterium]
MPNTHQVFRRIQDLQTRYLKAALGKEPLLRLIYESEVTEQVYNSNAIENSTLSLEETDKILNQIDLDRFVNERELFEAKNLARVVKYIDQKAKQEPLTLEMMLLLHQMLISNIRDEIAGRFRKSDEWVRVGNYIATDPSMVVEQLEDMMISYQTSSAENIITRIARFHLSFEHIHPFVDGNGRIGRVLNNYLLIREGHVPINIKFIDRGDYYDAFAAFDNKSDLSLMEQIVGKALTSSYHKRLAYLEGKQIVSLADYAKSSKDSHSNLLNKAKRQTIGAFWERGIWKIGM